jgi:Coenzyme PQQ synthesis protein D (PqqD)
MNEPLYERSTELLEANLGDELVALDAEGGNCFGFNSVATFVWRQLASPKIFAELRDRLIAEYEVTPEQCAEELQELLDALIEKRLIRVRVPVPGRPQQI